MNESHDRPDPDRPDDHLISEFCEGCGETLLFDEAERIAEPRTPTDPSGLVGLEQDEEFLRRLEEADIDAEELIAELEGTDQEGDR